METISHKPKFTGIFPDKRLDKRADRIALLLMNSRTSSIKGTMNNEADQKGFYRFLENDQVEESQLVKELSQRCCKNVKGRSVLCIEDSSSIGLSNHSNRLKFGSGIGLAGNKVGLGFLLHTSSI